MLDQGLGDAEWEAIVPYLPNKSRGVARVDDRRVIGGILWVLRNKVSWRRLPPQFGAYTTCYNRYVRWNHSGTWDRLMNALAAAQDMEPAPADSDTQIVNQRRENTRGRILNTALKLFALGGFDGVSTRQIAAAASVPPASLRYYFHSKMGLRDACLAHIHRLSLNATTEKLAAAETLLADPSATADQMIDVYCDMQDGYVDVLIGSDDGTIALFVLRHDFPTEKGLSANHSDDPLGARIHACHVNLLKRLTSDRLTEKQAILVWVTLHGQLLAVCMSRPKMVAGEWEFTPSQIDEIKYILRRQTTAALRGYQCE